MSLVFMVKSQRKLLLGVVAITAAFLPLDLIFSVPQTPGLISSRLLLFAGFGGVGLFLPRMSDRARTLALTALGIVSPVAVALMVWGTGGTPSPAFSFMWALPMLVGMVCLEEPTADLAATLVTGICGSVLLLHEGRSAAQLLYFLMVTVTGGTLGTVSTYIRRRNHRAELARMAENQSLLSGFIEAMPAAVVVADADGTPRYSNALATELLGPSVQAPAFIAGTDQPYPHDKRCMHRALKGEASQLDDLELAAPDGSRRNVEVRGAPRRGPDGKVTHGIAMLLDITERRRTEAALREAQERLAQADRISSLGTLAAGVAHEINNPLAFIATNVSFAAEELAQRRSGDELRDALADAHQGVLRVRDIVRDLQLFSHSHEAKLEPTAVDRCLDAALALAGNEVRHRARLVRELSDAPLAIANGPRLIQVLVNLLTNAAQAIDEGRADANTITVRLRGDGSGHVVIEVADTGHGIAAHVLPRIFEPFFTTRPQGMGPGLGLSICHGIVAQFGGALEVQTAEGKGSTFRVRLLAAPPVTVAQPAPVVVAPAAHADRQVIVVIDDEPLVGKSLKRMLERSFAVHVFGDAREALTWLERGERCDAILCDVMMPVMGGAEFLTELTRRRPGLASRVVFATGGAFSERSRQLLATARYRVEKPFVPDMLMATLREVMQQGSAKPG
ncbi:MAG: response regulator [Archangiaceae bacterium]|nr:response regulator [Archangiaceae bacterium]